MEGIEEENPVAQPKDFTFCQVNEFVHNPNVYFEDMQGVCLDMADHIDRLREVEKSEYAGWNFGCHTMNASVK